MSAVPSTPPLIANAARGREKQDGLEAQVATYRRACHEGWKLNIENWKPHMGSQWEVSGKPVGSQWEASGKPVGQWEASGKSVGSQWEASGKSVGSQWEAWKLKMEHRKFKNINLNLKIENWKKNFKTWFLQVLLAWKISRILSAFSCRRLKKKR